MDELPYLAGFIDGEGSIAIGISRSGKDRRRRWYLRFSCHQVDIRPLRMLERHFGGTIRPNQHPGRQLIHEWVTQADLAYAAIHALRPWLIVKATQADLGMEFQEMLRTRDDSTPRRTPLSESEQARREELYLKMRALKHYDET